jgi:hypothetical protein
MLEIQLVYCEIIKMRTRSMNREIEIESGTILPVVCMGVKLGC